MITAKLISPSTCSRRMEDGSRLSISLTGPTTTPPTIGAARGSLSSPPRPLRIGTSGSTAARGRVDRRRRSWRPATASRLEARRRGLEWCNFLLVETNGVAVPTRLTQRSSGVPATFLKGDTNKWSGTKLTCDYRTKPARFSRQAGDSGPVDEHRSRLFAPKPGTIASLRSGPDGWSASMRRQFSPRCGSVVSRGRR